ncbi:MAG: GMC oxidoreductase, partial [Candidatus Latescibacterota bacterium]
RIEAKNDLAATLLRQGQERGLQIMAATLARRLVEEDGHVRALECVDRDTGRPFSLEAGQFVLAAGALRTPALLLDSWLERFPQHDLIGRYLMRHCNAVASYVFPYRTNPGQAFHKQVCVTDFYEDLRQELGTAVGVIQDIYTPAPIVLRIWARRGFRLAASLLSGFAQNLLCIAEDQPRPENCVRLSAEKDCYGMPVPLVRHEYAAVDRRRCRHLLGRASAILRRAGGLVPYVHPIDSFSHALGTVRCGGSPAQGVLDPDCRFWGIDNLTVADGSAMPASGGVNPSLTIAANALRVAWRLVERTQGHTPPELGLLGERR